MEDDLWAVAETKPAETEMQEIAGEKVPVPAIRGEIARVTAAARAIVVTDTVSFKAAVDFAAECARREALVDTRFAKVDEKTKAAKKVTDEARSEVLALIRELKAPFTEAKVLADGKAQVWQRAENKRLALEAELKRREEQTRLEAARDRQVVELEKSGAPDLAAAVQAETIIAEVKTEKVEVPKGTTFRAHWKGVCYDFALLVKDVAAGLAPLDLLVLDQSAADGWARITKGEKDLNGLRAQDVGGSSHS